MCFSYRFKGAHFQTSFLSINQINQSLNNQQLYVSETSNPDFGTGYCFNHLALTQNPKPFFSTKGSLIKPQQN